MFGDVFMEVFTTQSTDGRTVALVAGGENVAVTFRNRHAYAEAVLRYRCSELSVQVAAIRRGLARVVPVRLLQLFQWHELQAMVCGRPDVDIELLKQVCEYSGCRPADRHVLNFWTALTSFSQEERSLFVRFVWGRARLPLTAAGFSQRFKLQGFVGRPADSYLPVAHTCFFSLELPAYSSLAVLTEKLRYAIRNCVAIDADDTGTAIAAAQMGWDE